MDLLSLSGVTWEYKESYRYGYAFRYSFCGMAIMYGGSDDMGCCIEFSGQGCRAFEDYSSLDWFSFLAFLMDPVNEFHITHIDLAFDDHSGILDMQQLLDDTDEHYYRSRSRWWKVEYGSCGTTIYHGSPKSNFRVRIYDKAAERGLLDGTHWLRVEIVLRDTNASGAVSAILERNDIGTVFSGLLSNYLVYCVPSNDSNRSRWEVADYWDKLINGVAAIRVASSVGLEYNIWRLQSYLFDQAGGAIYTWLQIEGIDSLVDLIKCRNKRLNPKYKLLMDQSRRLDHD